MPYKRDEEYKPWVLEICGVKFVPPFPDVNNVIFNPPATVVFWTDGTKTVVKCGERDTYDPEKGLAMAIAKRAMGNKDSYFETFKKWVKYEENSGGCGPDYCELEVMNHVSDFTWTMENWRRMCRANSDEKVGCHEDCPLMEYNPNGCGAIYEGDFADHADWPYIGKLIDDWVENHPMPVYPTWDEWLESEDLIECWSEIGVKEIPAYIAEKLGIKPKSFVLNRKAVTNHENL